MGTRWTTGILALLAGGLAHADLSLPDLFSDHLVLQQGRPNLIWGEATPGAVVTVTLEDQPPRSTRADASGRWETSLPALTVSSNPRTLSIEADGEVRILQDVLVGEVWLCSGQSNMEWKVRDCDRFEEVVQSADRPLIRMFTVRHASTDEPVETVTGRWEVCQPDTVGEFSGTAFHFGLGLADELGGPVGLVHSSWGGSTAEAWSSQEALRQTAPGRRSLIQWEEIRRVREDEPERYAAPTLPPDRGRWAAGEVPGYATAFGLAQEVDGLFWIRIPLEIPAHWAGRPLYLSLGGVDDDDVTYFNGVEVGATRGARVPRTYRVPGTLVEPGATVIAVEVTDRGGPAGLYGPAERLYVHPIGDPADRLSLAGPASMMPIGRIESLADQHKPAHLFNAMLHPLRDYGLAGVAWYQGESNAIGEGRAEDYQHLLSALIEDWRRVFDDPELPFLIVQLPNWNHPGPNWDFPRLRESQRRTHERVPKTGLIVTTDIGDPDDIHPGNKHDVGQRLADWALAELYGREGVVRSGPLPSGVDWGEDVIRIAFEPGGSPLAGVSEQRSVSGCQVAGASGVMVEAESWVISDHEVMVAVPLNARPPTCVRYAWTPDPRDADLTNEAGLPASPFEFRR